MGSSCSSGQGHKDKDSVSTKSEESPAYQVNVKKSSDEENKIITPQQGNYSEVILEPKKLPEPDQNAAATKTRTVTTSISDTISNTSPPTLSPKEYSEPPLPQELSELPENFQNLIIGKLSGANLTIKTRKIVLYVCVADSLDCCVEKGVLHQTVVPELRNYCRDKGYELHISDLHWKSGLEKQQDHEFPELCLGELNRQMEVSYIIPVLFLSNSLGTPILPNTIESQDFEVALNQAVDKDSLKKWYKLDSNAQPPCYRLQPVSAHIPGFKENSLEEREKALEEWKNEVEKTLTTMITVFSEELRNTYLTTVVEQEVHNTILMSQELARRCLWLYRVFTQKPEPNTTISLLEQEQKRRLDIIYKELRSQLTEKHVVRLSVKWNQGGIIDQNIPEHAQYVSDVISHLMKYLKATIFNIIEEDQSKAVIRSMFGIESQFLNELKWQSIYCQKAAQSSTTRERIMQEIRSYLVGNFTTPLLVHGTKGSGKTITMARIVHGIRTWVPDSFTIYRFTLISELSYSFIDIFKSVCDQLSLLAYGHHTFCDYVLHNYEKLFAELMSVIAIQRPVIIIFDGLDHITMSNLDWLPTDLPNNAKLIISATTDSDLFNCFKMKFPSDTCYKKIYDPNKTEAESLLRSSINQYNHLVNSRTSRWFLSAMQKCTLPLYIKVNIKIINSLTFNEDVIAWRATWFTQIDQNFEPKNNLREEISSLLDFIDTVLGIDRVRIALSIIVVSKYGLRDSELLEILSEESAFHSETTHLKWAPACLFLSQITKYLNPFLNWISDGNNLALKICNQSFDEIIRQRYVQQNPIYNHIIQKYFKGSLLVQNKRSLSFKPANHAGKSDKVCKKRMLIEIPYQAIILQEDIVNDYLLNHSWLFEKICECGVYQILDDLIKIKDNSSRLKDLEVLQKVLEKNHISLNYDGRQMYSKFYEELKNMEPLSSFWKSFYYETLNPPSNTLLSIIKELPRAGDSIDDFSNLDNQNINLIVRLNESPNFVVSISTEKEEIAVWDLFSCEKVRTIKGVTHPISLQLIDDFRAVVLCRRELRIYNLDEGVLLTKLKGVMNQKMAYFGLHDKNHLVALSRNRMYVNLMHLESGDCIATFKAGEDRFLNSLLVSGDGRILVCGDETQKPFPLLVWNLSSRKLLYDLRIPHHDFLTNLSAITHEGHYVCCVAKEVDEPGPNFIVVYDLQSGTLFKKWKPGVDTTSLDISSKDSCVISGLADARILVWDLVTGNCRWSLRGHSAPVTLVRRDPCGGSFLSADICNRDRSFRLWDLNKGELLAVYTPHKPYSACELGIGGKVIALSLKGENNVKSLIIKGPGIEVPNSKCYYGKPENHGKVFNLSENDNTR